MERSIKFTNRRKFFLSGIVHVPAEVSTAGIIFLHGFAGKKDENGLFSSAANILCQNGYNVFRFDFTGAGDSQGDYSKNTLNSLKDDFSCALSYFVKQYNINKVGVIGFSLGATIALLGYNREITSMALWSPVLFPKLDMYPRYQTPELKSQLSANGYINKGELKVGEEIIRDLGKCNLLPYIKEVSCSVLLIHGDKDERIDYRNTLKAERSFQRAESCIIKNVGHSFKENYLAKEEVTNKTIDFFNKNILLKTHAKNLA